MQTADNFAYVVPVDEILHTANNPFCWDTTCPCHEEQDTIATVAKHVQDGLFTPQEATDFVNGKTL